MGGGGGQKRLHVLAEGGGGGQKKLSFIIEGGTKSSKRPVSPFASPPLPINNEHSLISSNPLKSHVFTIFSPLYSVIGRADKNILLNRRPLKTRPL